MDFAFVRPAATERKGDGNMKHAAKRGAGKGRSRSPGVRAEDKEEEGGKDDAE